MLLPRLFICILTLLSLTAAVSVDKYDDAASTIAKQTAEDFQKRFAAWKDEVPTPKNWQIEQIDKLNALDERLRMESENAQHISSDIHAALHAKHRELHDAMESMANNMNTASSMGIDEIKSQTSNNYPRDYNDHHKHFAKHKQNIEDQKRRMQAVYEERRKGGNFENRMFRDGGHDFSVSELHRVTNKGRPAYLGRDNDHTSNGIGETRSLLESHGVTDAVVQEINRLAASNIPREQLVQHIRDHFPGKRVDDLNDIVVSALSAAHRSTPKSALDHAKKDELLFNAAKFQRSKESFKTNKDL